MDQAVVLASSSADVVAVALAGGAALAAALEVRRRAQEQRLDTYRCLELRFSADAVAPAVADVLAAVMPPRLAWAGVTGTDVLVFEALADETGIRHFITVPSGRVEHTTSQLHAALPGSRVRDATPRAAPTPTTATELMLTSSSLALRADVASSSRAVLAALQPLRASEQLIVQWIAAPLVAVPRQAAGDSLGALAVRALGVRRATARPAAVMDRTKAGAPLVWALGRIGAVAEDVARARQLVARVRSAYQVLAAPGVRLVGRRLPGAVVRRRLMRRAVPITPFPTLLNMNELAAVIAWPVTSSPVPGVELTIGRLLPPSPALPRRGRVLGRAVYPGRERPVAQPFEATTHHSWVVGPTGSGKSVLLVSQALADIAAPGRRSVVVVDMKVDTADAVLARFPHEREDDLIVLDVTSDRPIGLNPLAGAHRRPELIADQLFAILRRLWHLEAAPRTSDLLYASLLTLAHEPGATIVDLAPLLTNPAYRARLTATHAEDPVLGAFWAQFAGFSDGERAQVIAPLLTRVRQVLLRSHLRVLLGQAEPAIDLARVLDGGHVLVVPMAAGVVGTDSAALLAALLLSDLWSAAQRRGVRPPERRHPAAIFVDEWQLASAGVVDMTEVFSLARGYGLAFTVANQSPSQLPPALRDAVFTNCRTKIAFGASASDAAVLARELGGGVTPADVHGLGRFQAIASVALEHSTAPPVTIATDPLSPAHRSPVELRRQSAQRYGRPRNEVEAEMRRRYAVERSTVRPGVRRRQP